MKAKEEEKDSMEAEQEVAKDRGDKRKSEEEEKEKMKKEKVTVISFKKYPEKNQHDTHESEGSALLRRM